MLAFTFHKVVLRPLLYPRFGLGTTSKAGFDFMPIRVTVRLSIQFLRLTPSDGSTSFT